MYATIILLAFAAARAQAHAEVFRGGNNDDMFTEVTASQAQKLAEKSFKIIDAMCDRAVEITRTHRAELDNTTLGKSGNAAIIPRSSHHLSTSSSVSIRSKPALKHASLTSNRCPGTSYSLYTQLRRQHGLAPVLPEGSAREIRTQEGISGTIEAPPAKTAGMNPDMLESFQTCDIENLDACTPSQLETIYIDALWDYHGKGIQTLTNEQFDQLKMELNWQGSGFPTLHRNEIKFTEAALAYARGEPILTDAVYEELKNEIKGMRSLNGEQFKRLFKDMGDQGIAITPTGASCTLSDTPSELQNDVLDAIQMYTALGVVPTTICTGAYYVLVGLLGGAEALINDVYVGFPIVGIASVASTLQLVRYLGLTSPQILEGVCPYCQGDIREFAGDALPKQFTAKCKSCAAKIGINAETLRIEGAGGFDYVNSVADDQSQRSWDLFINDAALRAVRGIAGSSDGSNLGDVNKPATNEKKAKPSNVNEVISKEIKAGIFAWAVLLGCGLFGEPFIQRVRGKGIAIHSGTINDFCKRFAIPAALRQKYIQTAKRNGQILAPRIALYRPTTRSFFSQ